MFFYAISISSLEPGPETMLGRSAVRAEYEQKLQNYFKLLDLINVIKALLFLIGFGGSVSNCFLEPIWNLPPQKKTK